MKKKNKIILNIVIILIFLLYDLILVSGVMQLFNMTLVEFNESTIISDMSKVLLKNIIMSVVIGVLIYGVLIFIVNKITKMTKEDTKSILKTFLIFILIFECINLYYMIENVAIRIDNLDTMKIQLTKQYEESNFGEGEYLEEDVTSIEDSLESEEVEETDWVETHDIIEIDVVEEEYKIQVKALKFSLVTSIVIELTRVITVLVSLIVFFKYATKNEK